MPDFAARRTLMVDTQVRPSDVTKFPIIKAMLGVARERFVPKAKREAAYVGENLDLGGRVMLDARSLAKMLDALDLLPTDLVLDVGAGLGYSSAVIADMVEAVVVLEDDAARAEQAQAALLEEGKDNAAVITGALAQGAAKHGPYDAITIQGGVEQVPDALLAQLKEGGRIGAIFMEGALGTCRIGHKIDGAVSWRYAFNATAPVLPGFGKSRTFTL